MTIQIWKKSRGNPIIYVTIKTSKEELHNLKLSLNQPTFNNYTKTLETYCQQEEKSFIKSEINAMIKKKAIVQTILLKKEKKNWQNESWNKPISRCKITAIVQVLRKFLKVKNLPVTLMNKLNKKLSYLRFGWLGYATI